MITFEAADAAVIFVFFILLLGIGFYSGKRSLDTADDYLLSGRQVGLFLFILTNVSTWYGGILGIGEFTYRYGLLSWVTQGFPYYIFAFLFAIFFARKIRAASLFTIPDKLTQVYGQKAGLFSALLVFILVSPAPYLLMTANLISLFFNISLLPALLVSLILSFLYLFKGGYKADLFTDAFLFFVMFGGFILIFFSAIFFYGGMNFLSTNLPADHLSISGGASPAYIFVWFLIALWTFADPGFHQRCYAAKSGTVAVKGIIISIFLWALFDFLTTSVGLYAKAALPDLRNPILSFPLLAEKILGPGLKGFFYAALLATIISTLNSFFFLSATTIGRDFIFRFYGRGEEKLKLYTSAGLIISGILALLLAYLIPSVIEIWYTVGSICIPGIILPVISAYYPRFKINNSLLLIEMILAVTVSSLWYILRIYFSHLEIFSIVEPMAAGLFAAVIFHLFVLWGKEIFSFLSKKG